MQLVNDLVIIHFSSPSVMANDLFNIFRGSSCTYKYTFACNIKIINLSIILPLYLSNQVHLYHLYQNNNKDRILKEECKSDKEVRTLQRILSGVVNYCILQFSFIFLTVPDILKCYLFLFNYILSVSHFYDVLSEHLQNIQQNNKKSCFNVFLRNIKSARGAVGKVS